MTTKRYDYLHSSSSLTTDGSPGMMWSLTSAKKAIITGACCAAVYTQLSTSPATIEFARAHGGTAAHVGILGALPTLMLFMQFVAAVIVNQLEYRRQLWFWTSLAHRTLLLPVAVGPLIWPDLPGVFWLWSLIAVTALNQAFLHFSAPLWLSWMGDYLPRDGLSSFWGARQYYSQWAAALSLAGAALYLQFGTPEIGYGFAMLIVVATIAGVVDQLFFIKVYEPRVVATERPRLREVLAEPFRHRDFRRFIGFMSFWHFSTMISAPFIPLFLLQVTGMSLFQVMMLTVTAWVGGAACSHILGRWTDEYGCKPVLALCVTFKSLNMVALVLCPQDPGLAFWVLIPVFMIDAALNSGILIANNGYLIRHSPAQNRTMYLAAGTAVAGFIGGITSIACGYLLVTLADWQMTVGSFVVTNFHLFFAISVVFRLAAIAAIPWIEEPTAQPLSRLLRHLASMGLFQRFFYPLATRPVSTNPAHATSADHPKPKKISA